jgi:predicted nucleic acid-binding protein
MSQRIHLAANVILRFLRNDDAKQSPAAARLFQKAAGGKTALFISAVTINEVFFAFTSFYKLSQSDVARKIIPFIRTGIAEFEQEDCLLDALQRVIDESVDFGDAYLAAFAARHQDQVASFDRDLRRFKDIKRYDFEDGN